MDVGFFNEDLSGFQAELLDLRLRDVLATPKLLDLPVTMLKSVHGGCGRTLAGAPVEIARHVQS